MSKEMVKRVVVEFTVKDNSTRIAEKINDYLNQNPTHKLISFQYAIFFKDFALIQSCLCYFEYEEVKRKTVQKL